MGNARLLILCLIMTQICTTGAYAEHAVIVQDCYNAVIKHMEVGCSIQYIHEETRCTNCADDVYMLCPDDLSDRIEWEIIPPNGVTAYGFDGECDPYKAIIIKE